MVKKKLALVFMVLVATLCFAAGTKRVSATKDRRCNQVVIVNNSSETVRIAQSDGVSVTGWIKSGQQSSLNVNSIVLEIGSNCSASSSISGRNFVVTVSGGNSSTYTGPANNHVEVHCVPCHGSGKCSKCNGDGYYYKSGVNHGKYKCDRCGGNGKCTYCHGTGRK